MHRPVQNRIDCSGCIRAQKTTHSGLSQSDVGGHLQKAHTTQSTFDAQATAATEKTEPIWAKQSSTALRRHLIDSQSLTDGAGLSADKREGHWKVPYIHGFRFGSTLVLFQRRCFPPKKSAQQTPEEAPTTKRLGKDLPQVQCLTRYDDMR